MFDNCKYVFLIYSSDIAEERKHIHVESTKGKFRTTAKFWLEPNIELVDAGDFSKVEINKIRKLIKNNLSILKKQIDKFTLGKKIKTIKL